MSLYDRFRNLWRKENLEQELDEELLAHVEMRARKNVAAGMDPAAARREALIRFGSRASAKEDARSADLLGLLESIGQDVRYAARMLRFNPGFAALAILTLAVAIGANTAIFSVVNAVLIRQLPYPDAARLAIIWSGFGNANRAPASTFELFQIRQRTKEFDQIGGIWVTNGLLPGEGDPEQVKTAVVTSNFLPLLCSRPRFGRFFSAEDQTPNAPFAIVISHGVWARRFGSNPAIVGKSVRFGPRSAVVIGILPENFRLIFPGDSSIPPNVDVFYSTAIDASNPKGPGFLRLVGHLRPGSNFARAQAEADSVAAQISALRANLGASVLRLRVISLQADDVGKIRGTLLVLFAGVGFVLIIGCANVANLLLARATKRTRETTVRAALGASRGRLARQLLTENILLGLLSGAVALAMAWAVVRAILAARPASLLNFGEAGIDWRVLAFTFAASVLTAIIFGLAPIIAASRIDLVQTLKDSGRPAQKTTRRWTGVLVSAEVALGFSLLLGTGLLMRSFINVLHVDPGFRAEGVFTFQLPPPRYDMLHELTRKLAAIPGVQSVAAVSHLPLDEDIANWYDYYWKEGAPADQQSTVMADHRSILPGYFATVGATLLSGRDFTESDDPAHEHVVIIDDILAQQLWPGGDAIGQRLNVSDSPAGVYQFQRDAAVVVGVVRHIQCHSLTAFVRPQIYIPFQLAPRPMAIVMRTSGALTGLEAAARKEVSAVNRNLPVSRVAALSEYVSRARSESRFASLLAISLSGVALVLACVGIYGVLSCSVAQRTSEIGVRMALGATRSDVTNMVLAEGLTFVVVGLLGGIALSLLLTPALSSLLFGVKPGNPANYAVIAILVLLVGALASCLPARRAMSVDPLSALRCE
ncbi:MAG TPA: ABC transporter permease [Candidatus Acidoferrales bacterium]|nr:ABC transporter permease [Candidatus Acidoferrales bacterium]